MNSPPRKNSPTYNDVEQYDVGDNQDFKQILQTLTQTGADKAYVTYKKKCGKLPPSLEHKFKNLSRMSRDELIVYHRYIHEQVLNSFYCYQFRIKYRDQFVAKEKQNIGHEIYISLAYAYHMQVREELDNIAREIDRREHEKEEEEKKTLSPKRVVSPVLKQLLIDDEDEGSGGVGGNLGGGKKKKKNKNKKKKPIQMEQPIIIDDGKEEIYISPKRAQSPPPAIMDKIDAEKRKKKRNRSKKKKTPIQEQFPIEKEIHISPKRSQSPAAIVPIIELPPQFFDEKDENERYEYVLQVLKNIPVHKYTVMDLQRLTGLPKRDLIRAYVNITFRKDRISQRFMENDLFYTEVNKIILPSSSAFIFSDICITYYNKLIWVQYGNQITAYDLDGTVKWQYAFKSMKGGSAGGIVRKDNMLYALFGFDWQQKLATVNFTTKKTSTYVLDVPSEITLEHPFVRGDFLLASDSDGSIFIFAIGNDFEHMATIVTGEHIERLHGMYMYGDFLYVAGPKTIMKLAGGGEVISEIPIDFGHNFVIINDLIYIPHHEIIRDDDGKKEKDIHSIVIYNMKGKIEGYIPFEQTVNEISTDGTLLFVYTSYDNNNEINILRPE